MVTKGKESIKIGHMALYECEQGLSVATYFIKSLSPSLVKVGSITMYADATSKRYKVIETESILQSRRSKK